MANGVYPGFSPRKRPAPKLTLAEQMEAARAAIAARPAADEGREFLFGVRFKADAETMLDVLGALRLLPLRVRSMQCSEGGFCEIAFACTWPTFDERVKLVVKDFPVMGCRYSQHELPGGGAR